MSQRQRKDKHTTGDARLTAGNMICDVHPKAAARSLFLVVGHTYSEIAMVRLFAGEEMTAALEQKCYLLGYSALPAGANTDMLPQVLYADLSRLIIKERIAISSLLDKHPERLTGTVDPRDITAIIPLLLAANTISKETKDRYFL